MLTRIAKISSSSNNVNSFIRICCNKRVFRGICSVSNFGKTKNTKRNVSDIKRKKKKSSTHIVKGTEKEIENKSDINDVQHKPMKYSATVQQYVLESATPRTEEQHYNVFEYMTNLQQEKAQRSFQSLQPSSIKPYGSTDNAHSYQSLITPRKLCVQYPKKPKEAADNVQPISSGGDRRLDSTSRRNFSMIHLDDIKQPLQQELNSNVNTPKLESREKRVPYRSFTEKLQQTNNTNITVNSIPKTKPIRIHFCTSKPAQGVITKIYKMNKTSGRRNFSSFAKRYETSRLEPDECRPKINDEDCLGTDCDQSIRADSNLVTVPKQLPKLDASKCPCLEPEIPTHIPKIRRLKLNFSDPPNKNVCPPRPKCIRADDGMQFGPKKLPVYMPGNCECAESEPLKSVPLVRLAPKHVEEPKRDLNICLPPPCPPRADVNLKVQPQKLPTMPIGSCPCVEPYVPQKNPSVRRLNFKFQDKPRICPVDKCPPRADDSLKPQEKRLPVIKAGPCECIEAKPPVDIPLIRLKAKMIEEPKRQLAPCLPPPCPPRADEGIKLERKKLPVMPNSTCPCVEDYVPSVNPKVRRLKLSISEPKRVCPPEPPCIRADDGMIIKQKNLAPFLPGSCQCIENTPMVDVPLVRLKPKVVLEPKRSKKTCEPPPCSPRADDKLKLKPKPLPVVPKGNCPCIEPELPTETPSLRRLVLKIPEPPRVCPVSTCGPRADDLLPTELKKLPLYVPGECKCIEPTPLEDVPLVRLKAKPTQHPPRSMKPCLPTPCPPRSDENLRIPKKKLPKIEIGSCPCVEEYIPDKNPKLHRLKKVFMDKDNKCPQPPKCIRADDSLVQGPKKLPKFTPGDCVCVESEPLSDVPLARLKPKVVEEPKRNVTKCLPPPCPPRADDKMKINAKHLPLLKVGLCPCIEPEIPTKMPALRKLNLKLEDRPLSCPAVVKCPPRADDNLDIKQKQLPVYKPGHCECIEPTPLVDVPLKRLKKRCDDDHPKYQHCDIHPRADKGCWEYPPKKLLDHCNDSKNSTKRKYCTKSFKTDNLPDNHNLSGKGIKPSKPRSTSSSLRTMSSVSVYKKNKNKKNVVQQSPHAITCKKRCPKFLYKKCPAQTIRICGEPHYTVCCEKKNSPYPAFSEVMRTTIKPFTKQTNWRCESVRYGFDPKVRANNRTYCTNMARNSILSKKFSVIVTPKCALHTKINTKPTNKCRKKSCPKFILDNCPPKVPRLPKCNEPKTPYGNCRKQTAPYPSFTDCLDQEFEEQLMECPMERERYLLMQPKSAKAITLSKTILKLPPPHQGKIDPHKEEHCIRQKLKKPNLGLTQTCADFGEPYIPMRARDLIKPPKNPRCPDIKQKGIRRYSSLSCLTAYTSNYHFPYVTGHTSSLYLHSLQSKSPFLDLFNSEDNYNVKSGKIQLRKISTVISRRPCCVVKKNVNSRYMAKKSKRLTLSDSNEHEEKPKKNPESKKPVVSKISPCRIKDEFIEIEDKKPSCPEPVKAKATSETTSNESKQCFKECPKFPYKLSECKREIPKAKASQNCYKEKKSSVCVPAQSQVQPTTLWQKIVKYFQAREGCPTAEELLQQRLLVKAEKAAHAAGMCLCDPKQLKQIKSSCERKQSQQVLCQSRRCLATTRSYVTKKGDKIDLLDDDDTTDSLEEILKHFRSIIEILEKQGNICPDHPFYNGYKQLKSLTADEFDMFIKHQEGDVCYMESPRKKESIRFSCKFAKPSTTTDDKSNTNFELTGAFQDLCNKIESSNGEPEKKILNELNLLSCV